MLAKIRSLQTVGCCGIGIMLALFSTLTKANDAAQILDAEEDRSQLVGQLNLKLRTYAEDLQIINGPRLHAVVESARLIYQSDYIGSGVGFGVDVGLYGAVKLYGDDDSRNMVHYKPDGTGSEESSWSYMGEALLKMKIGDTILKYGRQPGIDNPYMPPYDIRALPPTFEGLSVISNDIEGLTLSAGSFNRVIPRGDNRARGLSTAYGGIEFSRISYAGMEMDLAGTAISLYTSRSEDLWNQHYFSVVNKLVKRDDFSITGKMHSYFTKNTGSSVSGKVDGTAAAFSITVQKAESSVLLGYQIINSDQFFDYTQETAGVYLTNAMGVDYNAPHERSLQLRYTFDGSYVGIPGFKVMAWCVKSHGVDSAVAAQAHNDVNDPLYGLYWRQGQYASGGRKERAIKFSYVVQQGQFKDMKIAFYTYRNRIDPLYPSKSFDDVQLMINLPVNIF